MYFKRLLIALIGLSLILTLTTSCENDRDRDETEEPSLNLEDLSKTYTTKSLLLNAKEAENEVEVKVTVNKENLKATFELVNLIIDNPNVSFETTLIKKESGAYAFNFIGFALSEGEASDRAYEFEGSFVGSTENQVILVTTYKDEKALSIEDLLKFETTGGSPIFPIFYKGKYNKENLYINGIVANESTTVSATSPVVDLSPVTDDPTLVKIRFSGLAFLGANPESQIKLKRGEKTNTLVIEDFVYEIEDRAITIGGYFDINYVLHLTTSLVTTSDLVGKWNFSINDNLANFNISFASKVAVEKDQIYSEKLENIVARSLPLAMKDFIMEFKENGKVRLTYSTSEGLVEFPTELFFYTYKSGNKKLLRIAYDGISADKILEANSNIILADLTNITTTLNAYKFVEFEVLENENGEVLLALATIRPIKGFVALAKKLTPTTKVGFEELGIDFLTEAEITELSDVYDYIAGVNSATMSLGLKRAN